jgi:predicted nuclease of predicted toxin-antitoxin system
MKVLLDEDLPHKLRLCLLNHDASTVAYVGWNGLKNGELLSAAETAGFEVFVTGDKKLRYQQNLKERRIGIVLLSAQDWPTLKGKQAEISSAVDAALPGSFQVVECGEFRRS